MVRQYIGARYVTKIYENSLDPSSAEWEAGASYEPLTLVTYLNSSYLSKKEVPPSVGNPASNPTYWVVTGEYNGQILSLQNQIDAISSIVNTDIPILNNAVADLTADVTLIDSKVNLKSKKYIVICDSYGNYNNTDGRNFYKQAFYELGIDNYYDFHKGSTGFSRPDDANFLYVLQENESAIADKSTITDIIVLGGANDQQSASGIDVGISAFMAYVKANYPNAQVHIGAVTHGLISPYMDQVSAVITNYITASLKYGASYIANSEYIMAKLVFYQDDNVHPSEDGNRALTKYFKEYLLGNVIDVHEQAFGNIIARSPDLATSSDLIMFNQHNGIVTAQSSSAGAGISFTFTSGQTIPAGIHLIDGLFTLHYGFFYSLARNGTAINGVLADSNNVMNHAILFAYDLLPNKDSKLGLAIYAPSSFTLTSGSFNFGSTAYTLFV